MEQRMPQPEPADWGELGGRLRSTAVGLTGHLDRAEDLTQQVLARLLARGGAPPSLPYARKALVRQWIDQQRSWRRRTRRLAALALIRPLVTPPAGSDDQETRQAVARAVDALPARQRAALVLRLVEDLPYERIAEILDCSVPAVRANLHLARRRMRDLLEDRP